MDSPARRHVVRQALSEARAPQLAKSGYTGGHRGPGRPRARRAVARSNVHLLTAGGSDGRSPPSGSKGPWTQSARLIVHEVSITWTYESPGLAYISLTANRSRGSVRTSVELSDLAETEGIDSLHSLVLDFDAENRLVGIEIPANAEKVLPPDLLAEHGG